MNQIKKCKHDYKPHQFIRCEHDDYGNTIYVYALQCMKCGKKPFFQCHKSKNQMLALHDFKMKKSFNSQTNLYLQIRTIILTVMLIVKDAIKWIIRCLIATILVSVCMENGWILSNDNVEVSYAMFWKLYSAIFVLVPLIMFYRGITGKYRIEIAKQEKKD